MNDAIQEIGLPAWQPYHRPDGTVEISVNFYHPETGRKTFGSLTPAEYITVWEEGRLAFQKDGMPKPDHLPTPEQVTELLSNADAASSRRLFRSERERASWNELRMAVVNTVSPTIPADTTERGLEVFAEDTVPVTEEIVQPPLERRRRTYAEKITVLEHLAPQLLKEKCTADGGVLEEEVQIEAHELIAEAAQVLRMSYTGMSSFWYRSVPEATRAKLLYGEGGRKRTRKEIKFDILIKVREQLRQKGGLPPRKKELAEAAAKPLGMTLDSTRTYIYDRLTPEEVAALDLRKPQLSRDEQVAILKQVRKWMKEQGYPPPRITDLARISAPYLGQKFISVRTLITRLSDEVQRELDLLDTSTSAFAGIDPTSIREAFLGAFAVLRFKKLQPTIENLESVLRIPRTAIESYIAEHPDIKDRLAREKL